VQLEFIHTFNTFSYIRTPFLSYYLKTISSSKKTLNDHLKHYEEIKVPQEYGSRLTYILYGIDLPDFQKREDLGVSILHILFAGRSTFEKRVHIVAAMAKKAADLKMPVQFDFMGEVKEGIPADLLPYCNLLGTKSGMEIFDTYRSCHILVVSSLFEGFPFVVMEAMSQGLAIVSTPVGDVPVHVANYNNGYIIPELNDEEKIVDEGIQFIKMLIEDRQLLQQISARNQEEGYAKFNMPVFNRNYQSLFDSILGN
jgi:glycosyltransferase involved in cell wall biosynthesis